ncbi:MBG domain-containing protein [Erythrobacter sp. NE805]|uniref:MBG domain-containing protein n=1 Tax=Erythrobacter sp. NE805 TaxID=3389875 RepID=UPI00396B2130
MLAGCASTALALSLALAASGAGAQGINAQSNVVVGSAEIYSYENGGGTQTTQIDVYDPTVVIDWTPLVDALGNTLEFLPAGNEAIFQNGFGVSDFAVLNRILPDANGAPVVINGAVISRIRDFSSSLRTAQPMTSPGVAPGGFVAFYSPTGFLIGSTASFDVGQLMLTTLAPDPQAFGGFRAGETLALTGAAGSRARISIAPGAQITASADNAFFAVVAADVKMEGIAHVNGSHAYVAGEVVNLRLSNGLFDIEVPVGTAASGNVLTLDGTIGGPASSGAPGDNRVIYGVAAAQNDPISMLFSGNLGFEPAQSADIVNGEIILAANHNVAGRTVAGGAIDQGLDARFDAKAGTSSVRADIFIDNVTATSSLMAVGTHLTRLSASGANASVAGNLLLAGGGAAEVRLGVGRSLTVGGDLLVASDAFGVSSVNLALPSDADAEAGAALVEARAGATLDIAGALRISADATAGANLASGAAGSAQGGSARLVADGASVTTGKGATLSAEAIGATVQFGEREGVLRGGLAELSAQGLAEVTINGTLVLTADAYHRSFGAQLPGAVYGGTARLDNGSSRVAITGDAFLTASASAAGTESDADGALADAGEARVIVDGDGLTRVGGLLSLSANARGGYNYGRVGGEALGGVALAVTRGGGRLDVTGAFAANAEAEGGFGLSGGAGSGGVAGAIAETGRIDLRGTASAIAKGTGGFGYFSGGGNGGAGTGGTALFRAEGTLTQTAALIVGVSAIANADGLGGEAAQTDGTTRGGRGGDGRGGSASRINQADANFVGGAYILAGGDNGTLTTGALTSASARGLGGAGGGYSTYDPSQGPEDAGDGGDGFGGTAQVGTALFGTDGSLGAGLARFSGVVVDVEGSGGNGGREGGDGFFLGTGFGLAGNGTGGDALLTANAGRVESSSIDLRAPGVAGFSRNGGTGQGGRAIISGSAGGTIAASSAFLDAAGFGGFGDGGAGGEGRGGETAILLDGVNATFDGITALTAIGSGGFGTGGKGGDGTGGTVFVGQRSSTRGSGTFRSLASLEAHGIGGGGGADSTGGTGRGGSAAVEALAGSTLTFNALSVSASGAGGEREGLGLVNRGGDGVGGSATIRSAGSGSRIIVETNALGQFADQLNGGALLAALGLGGDSNGGNGVGGAGTGGTFLLRAEQGGAVTLPQTPFSDQGSPGAIRLTASGLGGGSLVGGGAGGAGTGGSGAIEAAGGTIGMGATRFAVYGEGGSSLDSALAIAGGSGTGGLRAIRVSDGGTLTGEFSEGRAGGFGGSGTGGANGGRAAAGRSLVDIAGGTFNIVGKFLWVDSTTGGSGAIGGDADAREAGGPEVAFRADGATITFTPDARSGERGLDIGSRLVGGNGASAGGNAFGGQALIEIRGSTLTNGNLRLENTATGGNGGGRSGGSGGNAAVARADVTVTGSTLGLSGSNIVTATARGGAGFTGGIGGSTQAPGGGSVNVTFDTSSVTIAAAGSDPSGLVIGARGLGGAGSTTGAGNSRAANLTLTGGSLSVGTLLIDSLALSVPGDASPGGNATSSTARLALGGGAQLTADTIGLRADASTSPGGRSTAGEALVDLLAGSPAQLTAGELSLSANAQGAGPNAGENIAGRFAVTASSGTLDLARLSAAALGDALPDAPVASQLSASGGSIRVSGALTANALGDITLAAAQGGVIGNLAASGNATTLEVTAAGTIRTLGDGSSGSGIGGQSITLLAGRSLLLGGSLVGRGGAVTLTANRGGGPGVSQPGSAVITMAQGSRIDAGAGTVTMRLLDGGSDPQRASGAITLAGIAAGRIDVRNLATASGTDIRMLADGVLTASGSGRAIDLASLGGEVINLAGDAGLVLTGGGHYGIFAATPTGSQIGSFANYARRYNVGNAAAYDTLNPGGNFTAFRLAPVLTITANDASRFYGNANPAFTASFAGFQPGDGVSDLSGAPEFSTAATATSGIGQYAITVALGTLMSEQGYQFAIAPGGTLTVTPRPITITANNLSRVYGNANPALTFTVGGEGLVNGDQLSGALATTAGATTGVGNVAITQGTLAASQNYAVTFVDGVLSITARPITITANSLSRIYGNANPALTFTVGGDGLVNGDQLTGALATTAGATTGVGNVAITRGTLAAGNNYAVTFVNGQLTITPRAITVTADNLAKLLGLIDPALTFAVSGDGLVNGDQLSGSLTRDPGERVGTFAIRQGSLAAGPNYTLTYVDGTLTIDPPPTPPGFDNPTTVLDPVDEGEEEPGEDPQTSDDEAFGIDFPVQPEAGLIGSDSLLDDPVASGNDSLVTTTPGQNGGEQ